MPFIMRGIFLSEGQMGARGRTLKFFRYQFELVNDERKSDGLLSIATKE
jgi:hypothetical protein